MTAKTRSTLTGVVITVILALLATVWRGTDAKAERADVKASSAQEAVSSIKATQEQMIRQLDRIEDSMKELRKK